MKPGLTLNRDALCLRCGFPTVWEWTALWTDQGPQHVNCSGPGDATDVLRALDQLSDDDREYLLALIEQDGS